MSRIHGHQVKAMKIGLSLAIAMQVSAADSTWDGATDNLWDLSTLNWSGSTWTNGNSAIFPVSGTPALAIQSSGVQVQNMTITGDDYQFSGGPLDMSGSVFVATNKTVALTAPLLMTNNNANVFASGPGTVTLNAASNLFYNFKITDGRVIHSSGTTTVTRTNSDPENNPAFHISNGVFEVSGGLVVVRDDKYVIIGGKNGANSSTLLVQNGGVFVATNSSELLNAFYGMGNITVQNGGELNCRQLRVQKSTYAPDKNVVNINTGGILRLQQFTLDSTLSIGQKGTINFNGGTVIPTADNAVFLASPGNLATWANVFAYIREGGCRIDTAGKSIAIWQPLLNGAPMDGGLYKSGAYDLSLRGTNTFNGGVFIASGGLNIIDDNNLGAPPAALQRNITFSNTAYLISAANNSIHSNREIFVSSNTLACFHTQSNTQRLHGVINAGSASNWIYKVGSGQLILASGDTRTNTLYFLAFNSSGCGMIVHESGTTFLRHKSRPSIITPLYIIGSGNVFLLAGGSINLPETYTDCQYVNISSGGKLWITNGLFNAANQEILNGLTGSGTTTIQDSGILDCSTLRISQSSPPAAQTTVNIQTGGVIRLKNFYLDTANAGWGYLNLDGGRIEVKPGMSDFLGTGHTNWLNRITVYVRAGGMIISNSTSITIKNPLYSGAEHDGGLTKFGPGSIRLDNTNTYTGITRILEGELRMGTNNALPAANTVTLQAKGILHVADKALTLATLSGCGTISNCTALAITDTLETAPTGTLTFAAAALSYGTNWVACATNGQAGSIAITGNLDLSQTTLNLAAGSTLNREDVRYPLATYTGTLTAGFMQANLPSRWIVKHEPATKTLYLAYNFGSVLMVK